MDKCTVCGGSMHSKEEITTTYEGKKYHFCSEEHKKEFKDIPGVILKKANNDFDE